MSMKTKKIYLTSSPALTQILAGKLARNILKKIKNQKAFLIGLEGDLGGGKTVFVQGFANGLGIKKKVLSPTFVILKRFQIPKSKQQFKIFYHIDCYRIKRPKEVLDLGFKNIISNPENIVCIEWADKVKKILPKETLWIKFELKNKNQRKITFFVD